MASAGVITGHFPYPPGSDPDLELSVWLPVATSSSILMAQQGTMVIVASSQISSQNQRQLAETPEIYFPLHAHKQQEQMRKENTHPRLSCEGTGGELRSPQRSRLYNGTVPIATTKLTPLGAAGSWHGAGEGHGQSSTGTSCRKSTTGLRRQARRQSVELRG